MSLNNNGIITYEDYVVSENEHDDQDDYTSSDDSENEENEENGDYENEEKKDDYENEEKKDDYDSDNIYEYNSSEENYESSDSENEENEEKREIEVPKENEEKKDEEKKDEEINFIEKKSKRQPKIVEECGICAETLNRSNRKEIKCLFCNYVACRSCYEQYLIQSTENICMNCKAVWNREFLDENFTKVFMKGKYKKRREDILMDKQKALLQSTLPIAETRNSAKVRISEINERRNYLNEQIKAMGNELNNLENEFYRCRNQINSTKADESQNRQFVKKCPTQECRGFLSTRWKCGLCNINVCSQCHEIKNEENQQHVCKEENVETAKLLAKDCKNCPKCGTYIYKIDGCDQMYCMQCHTAFSWQTGQIETGRIHNPHYYEWLRKGGKQQRELLDIPCGGIPQVYNMRINIEPYIHYQDKDSYMSSYSPMQQLLQRNYLPSMYNTIRLITHIQDVSLRSFQEDIEKLRGKELDLRCEYLMKEIDEEQWKTILQQNEYKLEYLTDLSQLYQMFSTVSSDIILFIYNTSINSSPRKISASLIVEKMDEIYELVSYFNNNSHKLAKRFGKKTFDSINNYSIEKTKI